jgi:SAM-dependent methyltransferase
MATDYSTVTEIPGSQVTSEQLARVHHRYRFAEDFCRGRDVLEVACGAGLGLGYLARTARRVVGGDLTERLAQIARRTHRGRVPVYVLDAHHLPFRDGTFDVVVIYEAVYYLHDPELFVREARRVLRKGGVLLIGTVNSDWEDFNPSPHSTHYPSAPELADLLHTQGFDKSVYGAFSSYPKNAREKLMGLARRTAVSLHLIPKTMKGKEFLKRLLYGELTTLDPEIAEGMSEYEAPVGIPDNTPNLEYKILYAVGKIKE